MNEIRDKAAVFTGEVAEWVGNNPYKAGAFGGACAFLGYLLNIWPL